MAGSKKVDRLLRNGLFLLVILMSLWMVFRSQVAGDQYRLLEPGWLPERVRELAAVARLSKICFRPQCILCVNNNLQ